MHSSEPTRRGLEALALSALLALAACAGTAPDAAQAPAPNASVIECIRIGPAAPGPQAADAQALRSATEGGPMFATLRAASPVQACTMRLEPGAVEIDWRMHDGSRLHVARDSRIELYTQEVHLVTPPAEEPGAWLKKAATAAFGEGACGIDWRHAETETPSDDPRATEQVFRGDACNCQARLRRDAGQRVTGALLRSAC